MKENYFLLARKDDEVSIVRLNNIWLNDGNAKGSEDRFHLLENIDLLTEKFTDEEEFINFLYEKKAINSKDVHLVICNKHKHKGDVYYKGHGVLYNPKNNDRIAQIGTVAKKFLNGNNNDSECVDYSKKVCNKLISKAYSNDEFGNMIANGSFVLPRSYTDLFVLRYGDADYSIKYKNHGMVLKNYTYLRDMVEALNRFDMLDKNNLYLSNKEFVKNLSFNSKDIRRQIDILTDKSVTDGQLSFLDFNGNINEKYIVSDDEVYDNNSNDIDNSFLLEDEEVEEIKITDDNKKHMVINTLKNLPLSTFNFKKDSNPSIKNELFDVYADDDAKRIIEKSLNSTLVKQMYLYSLHNVRFNEARNNYSNTMELEYDIRKDEDNLYKSMKDNKRLDKLYKWCYTYNVHDSIIGYGGQDRGKCIGEKKK